VKRFDPSANNGFVKWPANLPGFHSTGEGGMSVYALFPEKIKPGEVEDEFYNCFPGFGIKANIHESPLTDLNEVQDRYLLAAVCLGTSGGSWADEHGIMWTADWEDLQDAGVKILNELELVYGVEATLVTVLDT